MENKKAKEFGIRCRAIILNEGKLLVVKHPYNNFYVLPGGHMELGEDILECLKREIVEELGISPEIGRLLYINNFVDKYGIQCIEFFFEIVNSSDYLVDIKSLNRTHADEIAEVYWAEASHGDKILPKKFGEDFKAGKVISDQTRYIQSL